MKRNIIFNIDVDEFIILRGALNRFQTERYKAAQRLGKDSPDGIELMKESNMAKQLFDEVDAQWSKATD